MTICIAAMAENGKKIVVAVDRMITANFPISYEFETDDVPKIYRLGGNAVAMSAGNALNAHEVIEKANNQIKNQQISKIEQILEVLRRSYQDYRRRLVIERTLEPRGLTLDNYYTMQQKLVPAVVQEIESQLTNFSLQVELIVSGCRDEEECHLYTITHPGINLLHDAIGYVSIGSGAPHAMYYLIASDYKKSLPVEEVKKIVLAAKKKSEVAPGVGKQTELLTIPLTEEEHGDKPIK
ncbi:MAG TPA: hypothetical protein VMW04_04105 [Patescibacteria group bacterium]|nr:hypothetical protein [Patescibacteria group bacterium]